MKNQDSNNPYCIAEKEGSVLMLRLNFCLFLESKTYAYRDQVLETLDEVAKDDEIKTVVVSNDHPDFSLELYTEKWQSFFTAKNYEEHILRSFRTIDLLVLKLYSLKKVVISMLSKPVNAMLFNFNLIADLRIVSKAFYIDNNNIDMVNIPKGGAMAKYLMIGNANPVNAYFLSDKIFPDMIFQQNGVDRVFDPEELLERTMSLAQRFNDVDYAEIEAAKMNKSSENQDSFEIQLQKENAFLLSCIREKLNRSSQKIQRFH